MAESFSEATRKLRFAFQAITFAFSQSTREMNKAVEKLMAIMNSKNLKNMCHLFPCFLCGEPVKQIVDGMDPNAPFHILRFYCHDTIEEERVSDEAVREFAEQGPHYFVSELRGERFVKIHPAIVKALPPDGLVLLDRMQSQMSEADVALKIRDLFYQATVLESDFEITPDLFWEMHLRCAQRRRRPLFITTVEAAIAKELGKMASTIKEAGPFRGPRLVLLWEYVSSPNDRLPEDRLP